MTKVTYYMYPCDTCFMITGMMKKNGLDCAKYQNPKLRDMMGIFELLIE